MMTLKQQRKFIDIIHEKTANAIRDFELTSKEYQKTRSVEDYVKTQRLRGEIESYIDVLQLFDKVRVEK